MPGAVPGGVPAPTPDPSGLTAEAPVSHLPEGTVPDPVPTATSEPVRPAPSSPRADAPAPQPARPRTAAAAPKPRPTTAPAPRATPQAAPSTRSAPALQGDRGRIIDGLGSCLGATATTLGTWSCLPNRPDQIWTRTPAGQLVTAGGCLTAVAPHALAVQPCRTSDPAQRWTTANRLIVNAATGECTLVRPPDRRTVAITVPCGSTTEATAQFVHTG